MGSLFGGGSQQQTANNDYGLVNQALGPIINSIPGQINAYQSGPQQSQYGATGAAYNQLFGDSGIQSPGAATGNYNAQMGAASTLGTIGQSGTGNQQSAYNGLLGNTATPQVSFNAQNGLMGLGGSSGINSNANMAMNNLLNFSQTQQPEVQAAANMNAASNSSLDKTLLSQLGGAANPGALATQLAQQGAQSNAANSQALGSQLVGQNLSAQQAAGSLGNQAAGLQQGALEGAGSLANQNQSNATSAYGTAGNIADTAAGQFGNNQSTIASIFGNLQGQQQGSQQNAYSDLASMLGLDQQTLQAFLGAGSGAANQYGQQGQYQQNLGNSIQAGNENAFGGLLGGVGNLVGLLGGGAGGAGNALFPGASTTSTL
jgi:hypothetical protein